MRLEIVQLPKPIHRAVAYSLGFRQGPAAPVRHAFGFGFQSRGNQCVSLLLIILGLASPAGLNLPERTDPGGAHALDRKSTRLNSSHLGISYAVFCLKKKTRMRAPPHRAPLPRIIH